MSSHIADQVTRINSKWLGDLRGFEFAEIDIQLRQAFFVDFLVSLTSDLLADEL